MRTLGCLAVFTAALVCVAAPPAAADTPAGGADLGSADFTKAGTTVTVPTLAPCSVDGAETASSGVVKKTGLTFGGGTSSCTTTVVSEDDGTTATSSKANGKDFELSALVSLGGPRIKLRSYSVTCDANQNGTNARWSFSGMTGISALPSPVPAGYTRAITKGSAGPVLANAIFNIQFKPGDGSIAITMLRIEFAPASGITGSVTLGTAGCTPTP